MMPDDIDDDNSPEKGAARAKSMPANFGREEKAPNTGKPQRSQTTVGQEKAPKHALEYYTNITVAAAAVLACVDNINNLPEDATQEKIVDLFLEVKLMQVILGRSSVLSIPQRDKLGTICANLIKNLRERIASLFLAKLEKINFSNDDFTTKTQRIVDLLEKFNAINKTEKNQANQKVANILTQLKTALETSAQAAAPADPIESTAGSESADAPIPADTPTTITHEKYQKFIKSAKKLLIDFTTPESPQTPDAAKSTTKLPDSTYLQRLRKLTAINPKSEDDHNVLVLALYNLRVELLCTRPRVSAAIITEFTTIWQKKVTELSQTKSFFHAKLSSTAHGSISYQAIAAKLIPSNNLQKQKTEVLPIISKDKASDVMTGAELESYFNISRRLGAWLRINFLRPIFARTNYATCASVMETLKTNDNISPTKELGKIAIYAPFRALRTAVGSGLAVIGVGLALFVQGVTWPLKFFEIDAIDNFRKAFRNARTSCMQYLQREYTDWKEMAETAILLPNVASAINTLNRDKEEASYHKKINALNVTLKEPIKLANFGETINENILTLLLKSQQLQEAQENKIFKPRVLAIQHVALAKKYLELADSLGNESLDEATKLREIADIHKNLAAANIELIQFRKDKFWQRLPKRLDYGFASLVAIPAFIVDTFFFRPIAAVGRSIAAVGRWTVSLYKICRNRTTWNDEFPNLTTEGFKANFAACKAWFKSLPGKFNVLWKNFGAMFDSSAVAYISASAGAATSANPPGATIATVEAGPPARASLAADVTPEAKSDRAQPTSMTENGAAVQNPNDPQTQMAVVLKELVGTNAPPKDADTKPALAYLHKQRQQVLEGQPSTSAKADQPSNPASCTPPKGKGKP